MTYGAFPDVDDEDGEGAVHPEDLLALEVIDNAQFILDAQWTNAPPWVLAGCDAALAQRQMPIWRAWIRTVRNAQVDAHNYHQAQQSRGNR